PFVMRPSGIGEFLLAALACVSHAAFFAVERANLDLLMFLLMLGSAALWRRHRSAAAFVVIMLGTVMKFYPVALLALTLRERLRPLLAFAAAGIVVMAVYVLLTWREMSAGMPQVLYFYDM